MTRTPKWRRYLRFWGPNVDADVDEELRFHLDMREADYRARGLDESLARAAARERFGGYDEVAEFLRDHDSRIARRRRRIEVLDDMMQDVRYGIRTLRRSWRLTLAIIIVLALGVGANTAMFSVIDAVLLRPLPFAEPERLVALPHVDLPFGEQNFPQGAAYIGDVAAHRELFSGVAAYGVGGGNISGGSTPVRTRVSMATPPFFPLLGLRPLVGRTFLEAEGKPNAPNVTILSYGFWQRVFGGDEHIVGRKLTLNGQSFEIIGVMAPGVTFPDDTELWIPMSVPMMWTHMDIFRTVIGSKVIARLAPGATIAQAHSAVRAMNDRLRRPGMHKPNADQPEAIPLRDELIGTRSKTPLMILLGAVGFVLLVACANVSNLLLARASVRQREMAVRTALGAGRWRIVRQLLTESVLLAIAGAIVGVAVAAVSMKVFAALAPERVMSVAPVRLDWRVLLFTLVATFVTGVAFGLAPALTAARTDVKTPLSAGGLTGATARGRGLRTALVVSEIALALVLVTGAGLMLKSFIRLLRTDIGVQTEHAAMAKITLPRAQFDAEPSRQQFYESVLARLAKDPAVSNAGLVTAVPLSREGAVGFSLKVDGAEQQPTNEQLRTVADGQAFANVLSVSEGYFSAIGIRILQGRRILATDHKGSHVAVVSETMSKAYWPKSGALGKRVYPYGDTIPYTIVGIAADVRTYYVTEPPGLVIYRSFEEYPPDYVTFVARSSLDPHVLMLHIRDAIWSVNKQQAVFEAKPLDDVVSESIAPQRTTTLLITLFGAVALLLATVGIYAVIAFSVAQRTREIGIRMALGAEARGVMSLVLRQGLTIAAIGALLGTLGAFALTRVLSAMLYGVDARDPSVFVSAPLLLLGVAVLATLLPARRAARVDPVIAIRAE